MAFLELDTTSNSRKASGMAPSQRKGRRSIESLGGLSRMSVSSRQSILSTASHHSVMSASSTHTSSGSKNPITNDVNLNILVHDKLPTITKYKQFQRWKVKFFNRFDTYLAQSGMEHANVASEELQVHLEACLRRASVVLDRIAAGDLSPRSQKRTVKASQALKEFGMSLEVCRAEVEELVPAKNIDEKRKRYTKFHVGASLINDGFPQFVAMKELEEHVHAISDMTYDLETGFDSLNKQERELFMKYKTQVSAFCDIMADLDLYDIMLKCVEFLHPPEIEEDDDVEELTIFIKRYQRYHQHGGIKRTSSQGTDITDSGTDDEPSFRGDDDTDSGASSLAPPITVKIDVEDSETIAAVTTMVAQDLGFHLKPLDVIDITNQLTVRYGNDSVVEAPKTTTLKQLGIEHGDFLTLEQAVIPVTVRRILTNGNRMELNVLIDPLASIRELKFAIEHQQHQRGDGIGSIAAVDQRLFMGSTELDDENKSCSGYGIVSGSVLDLEAKTIPVENVIQGEEDSIVIVDTKYGTMFSVEREVAIGQGVLTPKIVNTDDVFIEATKKDFEKDRILKAMMASPNLGVKPRIVVAKMEIEDYDIGTADEVKSMWGVQLKKSRQNKQGTEVFFVDLKTKAVGFLDRRKLVEMNFITVVNATSGKTLEQAEKDQQKYDFYVFEIRKIFGIGIAFEESLGR